MAVGTFLVQADLSGTAYGSTPTWTDITSKVLTTGGGAPITITAWRQDEQSEISPSQCTLVLINDDGRFTPGLAAGAYYPHVVPGIRLRVSETVGGTTYQRFDGYVDSWEVTPAPTGKESLCAISATDILARMGTDTPLRSVYREEVLLDTPVGYWPLDEGSGTAFADLTGLTGSGLLVPSKSGPGAFAYGVDSGVVTDGWPAVQFTRGAAVTQGYAINLPAGKTPPGAWGQQSSVEFWFATSTVNEALLTQMLTGWPANQVSIQIDSGGHLKLIAAAGGVLDTVTTSNTYNDGHWHHCAVTADISGNPHIYVDGVSVGTGVIAAYTGTGAGAAIGATWGNYASAAIAHVAIYATPTLSATRIAAHHTAGTTAFAGESTGPHIARLLSYRANTGSVLDTGDGTVGVHDIVGGTLTQALQDTGDAEGGVLYVDGQGRVVLLARHRQYNTTVAFTLDGHSDQVAVGTTFRMDTQNVVNDAQVSRPNGASAQRVQDTTSQQTCGVRTLQQTLIVNTDLDALNAAGWSVCVGKTPKATSPSLVVDLLTEPSTTLVQAILAAVPRTRLAVTNLPATAPAASMSLVLEGWVERIGVEAWDIDLYTSATVPATLRADATADTLTKLDSGLKIGW